MKKPLSKWQVYPSSRGEFSCLKKALFESQVFIIIGFYPPQDKSPQARRYSELLRQYYPEAGKVVYSEQGRGEFNR